MTTMIPLVYKFANKFSNLVKNKNLLANFTIHTFFSDEARLLKMVPSKNRRQGQILLDQFNKRGNELTWNSDGIIFIDEVSIPNSDIYVFFPNLFKKSHPKSLPGFQDFLQKIIDMGLDHLISKGTKSSLKEKATKTVANESETKSSDDLNWWYLG